METIDTLDAQPFKNLVMSIGALPSSFVASMSYYEALAWLVNYLQTQVIPAVNNNAEALSELQTAFITLKDYVEHYFDNLDVQEEINNKLDDMAESGELAEIIATFLETSIYEESITFEKQYYETEKTHYYLSKIPYEDNDGNRIILKHGFSGDDLSNPTATEDIVEWSKRHNVTIATNASVYYNEEATSPEGCYLHIPHQVIHNGVVISDTPFSSSTPWSEGQIWYLGYKEDGTLEKYDINTPASTLIADGVVESFVTFNQVAINGVVQTEGQFVNVDTYKYPWILIGQNIETKDIYLFACDGKGIGSNYGMTLRECCNIMIEAGADNIFRLDGGGSTSFYYKGIPENIPSDNNHQDYRVVPDFIYFEKEFTATPLTDEMFDRDRRAGEAYKKANTSDYIKSCDNGFETYNEAGESYPAIRQYNVGSNIDNDEMSILLDPTAYPRGFAVYDASDEYSPRTLFRVEADGKLTTRNFTIKDEGWKNISDTTNNYTLSYRKIGDIVFFQAYLSDLTTWSTLTFNLPDEIKQSGAMAAKADMVAGGSNTFGKISYGTDTVQVFVFGGTSLTVSKVFHIS